MDWKKLGLGALAAFVAGAGAAMVTVTEGGITGNEWGIIAGAGLAALGLYLKDPNAHKGKDKRQKSKNPLMK